MSINKRKLEEREQSIIDVLKGNPDINERVWEKIEEKKIMSKQTFFNTRNKLWRAEKIGKESVGRQVWLFLPNDEELFRNRAGLETKENKIILLPNVRMIDEGINNFINKKKRIPTIEEIGVEIGKDSKDTKIHSLIFNRWAIIEKHRQSLEEIIEKLFWKNYSELKKKSNYDEKSLRTVIKESLEKSIEGKKTFMPSDEELMDKLGLVGSERTNLAIRSLIGLSKEEFRKNNIIEY